MIIQAAPFAFDVMVHGINVKAVLFAVGVISGIILLVHLVSRLNDDGE